MQFVAALRARLFKLFNYSVRVDPVIKVLSFLVAAAMTGKVLANVAHLMVYKKKNRGSVTHIADRLGNPGPLVCEWLILTAKENMPKPDVVSFPKPPKAADGSLMYDRIPNKPELEKVPPNAAPSVAASTSITPAASNSPPPVATAAAATLASPLSGVPLTTVSSAAGPASAAAAVPTSAASIAVVAPQPPSLASNNNVSSNMNNSLKRRTCDDSNGVDSKYIARCKHLQLQCSLAHRHNLTLTFVSLLPGFYSDTDWDDGNQSNKPIYFIVVCQATHMSSISAIPI